MLIDEYLLDKVTERAKASERQCIEGGVWDSHPRRSLAYPPFIEARHCEGVEGQRRPPEAICPHPHRPT
jgi:hypothetical protein